MAVRLSEPKRGNIAAAATLVLAGWFAGPAPAAPSPEVFCDEAQEATLEVSREQLAATTVSHEFENQEVNARTVNEIGVLPRGHLLKTGVEAAVREIFDDADNDSETEDVVTAEPAETTILNTRVPGVSNDRMARFKRQMLRKDI